MEKANETALANVKQNIADQVLARIDAFVEAGQLKLPSDYHAGNALKAAFLVLQETTTRDNKPVLEACTKESIAFALQKMVVLGLNPLKKQCDFIAYGKELQCSPEYSANEMLAKRYGMKEIYKQVVYKDDEFEDGVTEDGRTYVVRHKPCPMEKRKKENIIGAYATVVMEDGSRNTTIMTMEQIRDSWNQGATKGQSPAHKNFPDQMALKTVSNRATKAIIRSSDDAALLKDDIKDETEDAAAQKLESTVAANANKKPIDFAEDAELVSDETVQPKPEKDSPSQAKPDKAEMKFTPEEIAEIEREEAELAKQQQEKPGADLFGGKGRVRQPGF